MYKLVIVDDEAAIRRGMINYIPWEEMGFEVVDSFEDGKETIAYIQNHKVDVIVTDIEMAEVNGLDLIKYMDDNNYNIKVVILSGYKKFEYAQKALEYKVEHYLLKPIHLEEVKEVFLKLKKELDKNLILEQEKLHEKSMYQEALSELQDHFFVSLLLGGIKDVQQVMKKSKMLNLDIKMDQYYALLDIKIQNNQQEHLSCYEEYESKISVLNRMFGHGLADVQFFIANLTEGVIKIVVTSPREMTIEEFEQSINAIILEKQQTARLLFELIVTIKVERIFRNMNEFIADNYKFEMRRLESSKEFRLVSEDYKRLLQKYKLVIEVINDCDFESLENLLDTMFFEFRNLSLDHVKSLTIDMFSMLSVKFVEMGSALWIDMNHKIDYQEIMGLESLISLKNYCKTMLSYAMNLVDCSHNELSKNVVMEAMKYMKAYYSEDISLEIVADKYFLNPSYFSRLFKQYSGVTFTDYLIKIRMNEAQRLISTGKYKMYEVSHKLGYKSEKYFFRVFKNYSGYSPTEYYKSLVIQNEG